MLHPDAAQPVGDGQQEVVAVEVAHAEQPVGLADQVPVFVQDPGVDLQFIGGVGHHVEADRQPRARVKVDLFVVAACKHRRVHEGFEGHRSEPGQIAVPARGVQRHAIAPSDGQPHAGLDHDLSRIMAGRVEHHRGPLQVQHLGRHHHAPLVGGGRRQELERNLQFADALRHVDVEGIDLNGITHPGDDLAVRPDHQTAQLLDRPARGVVAGNPLGVEQGHLAGLRHRQGLFDTEDAPRGVSRVHLQADHA